MEDFNKIKEGNKKETVLFSIESSKYDTPKKENRSSKKISNDVLKSIEDNGVTIEEMEALGVPVFIYQTQITLHGSFVGLNAQRGASGYKTLVVNQNGTLGVKYVGIDEKKKKRIESALVHFSEVDKADTYPKFYLYQDSQGTSINSRQYPVNNKEEYTEKYLELKKVLDKLDKSLFIGNAGVYVLKVFGSVSLQIRIELKAIYEKNFYKFLAFLTNGKLDSTAKVESYKKQYDEIRAARKAEWDKEQAEKDKANADAAAKNLALVRAKVDKLIKAGYELYTRAQAEKDVQSGYVEYMMPTAEGITYNFIKKSDKKVFGKFQVKSKTLKTNDLLASRPAMDFKTYFDNTIKSGIIPITKNIDLNVLLKPGFDKSGKNQKKIIDLSDVKIEKVEKTESEPKIDTEKEKKLKIAQAKAAARQRRLRLLEN